MDNIIAKAKTLMEALPYIQKFRGKRIIIKYGGHAMVNEDLKKSFTRDIILFKLIGMHPIIVHGGGPQIEKVLAQMGIESKYHNGLRITDSDTMDVVEMVLGGKVNKDIVGLINHHGGRAVGFSGIDGKLIEAIKIDNQKIESNDKAPEIIDFGHVGIVDQVNPEVIEKMENSFMIPVIAPVGVSSDGESLNINADYVASAIAEALNAEKLILMTDVEGVKDNQGELISQIATDEVDQLINQKIITGGMIPKVRCAQEAVKAGVGSAHIIDGRIQHALLLEIFTDQGIGTLIKKS
jgi:acetylglutamate kinase